MKIVLGFNADSFFGKVQKTARVIQSSTPQITVATTKDKFVLNNAAMSLMGLPEKGGRVMILDMNIPTPGETIAPEDLKGINERYFIAQNLYSADKKGLVTESGDFSYTGPWGTINLGEDAVTEVSHKDLIAKQLVLERKGTKSSTCISYHKYVFDIERVVIEDEEGNVTKEFPLVAGGKPQPVFQLTNVQVLDHTPEVDTEVED
jgi:hypothetical protein